ncbi:hypothetical protein V8C86DRAFT_2984461 [Haematococcus lacustris]
MCASCCAVLQRVMLCHTNASSKGASCSRSRANALRCSAASATTTGCLSPQQVAKFREDGFLVLPRFSSAAQCDKLRQRMSHLLQQFDPDSVRSIFSTTNQVKLLDKYFLDSASNISYFFEEKAFDPATGQLRQPKQLSINKVGHALHDLDPEFRAFSRSPEVAAVLRSLGYRRPLPVQSMYIFKQPHIGGEVVPHQDSTFLMSDPLTCVGLWWALEDATRDNGCLWAAPGIHHQGLLRRFSRQPEGGMAFDNPVPAYDLSSFVPLECPAGSLVLLQGENVHYSCENQSPVSRHSYSVHFVESSPGHHWLPGNWAHREQGTVPWTPLYEEVGEQQG